MYISHTSSINFIKWANKINLKICCNKKNRQMKKNSLILFFLQKLMCGGFPHDKYLHLNLISWWNFDELERDIFEQFLFNVPPRQKYERQFFILYSCVLNISFIIHETVSMWWLCTNHQTHLILIWETNLKIFTFEWNEMKFNLLLP